MGYNGLCNINMKKKEMIWNLGKGVYTWAVIVVLLVMLIGYVSAFGVVSRYDEKIALLEMYPGQSIDTYYKIYNSGTTEEITVDASLVLGSEIAQIISGTRYVIPGGEFKLVDVRVIVPENAPIGAEYIIEGLFKQVEEGQSQSKGTLQFVINVDKAFRVKVISKPAELSKEEPSKTTAGSTTWIWVLVGIVIVVIVVWLILRKKK